MECMKEITERCPELRAVEVEPIEEREHADIADRYDYHYVPAFYIGGRKVHEGAAGSDDVEKVLRMALEE